MPRMLTLKDLTAQVEAVNRRIAQLEDRRAALKRELAGVDDEIAGLRGTRGPGRPPGRRGPGRPPGKRGPGRPPGSKTKARRNARKPGQPGLTDFLRTKIGKRPVAVAKLATLANRAGYKSANLPQVIRMMVAKARDLRRNGDDTIAKKGKPGRPPKRIARTSSRRPKARRPSAHPNPTAEPAPTATVTAS